ncbi:GNAT family N-acetyltransferase [Microbacterium kribbense]|uniref:GNAT family N-acetyltransferase n=1 Tax=Microbacterium kribbense TaxID=433645 RepID=A0ABP7GKT2_9MICO
MTSDLATMFHDGPADSAAVAALAAQGLQLRVVPNTRPVFDQWLQATARGFLDSERSEANIAAADEASGDRRLIGVYDPGTELADQPVGTFASWVTDLSVPGGQSVPAVAISAVTAAPTHRRRGIARAMMEGELRLAAAVGVPMAALTVSESTIYGRYGFAPAVDAAEWVLDTNRATWAGPIAPGRVDFIARERARALLPGLHERIRLSRPGEISVPDRHWDRMTGQNPDAEKAGNTRAVAYRDAAGEVTGVALYTAKENLDDFTKSPARITTLVAANPEAYAGLWRFFVELPLIGTVRAGELSVDEPLAWMISDRRAATVTIRDHHYLRILDVPAALSARRYAGAGTLVLDVTDPLGISGGRFVLVVAADGTGAVTTGGDIPAGAPVVALGTTELSAAYLGAVSLQTLADAGRVHTTDAAAATRLLAWPVRPQLSFWY